MRKLKLDEALFDDNFTFSEPPASIFPKHYFDEYKNDEYDDTIFQYEPLMFSILETFQLFCSKILRNISC